MATITPPVTTGKLSDQVQSVLVLASFLLIALGGLASMYVGMTIGIILGIAGIFGIAIKQALGSSSTPIPTGLTNQAQALVTLVSITTFAIGTVAVPIGAPFYIGVALQVIGAVGLALKEWVGTSSSPTNLPNSVQSAINFGSVATLMLGQYTAVQNPSSWHVSLALGIAAAVGLAIQEWISPPASTATTTTTTTSAPVTASASTTQPIHAVTFKA